MTPQASETPRVALVTGAGKRVGRAIAEGLAADGYTMALHYNSSAGGAEDLARDITARGGKAVTLHQDLGNPETAGD
ncbi:MAG: SDR family NAD(P)-dependent oxidoreductase, partial [Pseudomonadota bacterium]